MAKRRASIKQEAIAQLGGVCVVCGIADDLEFDHVDPSTKLFQISGRGLDKPRALIAAELLKCQLLCRPHHLEKTRAEASLPRPGRRTAQHGVGTQVYDKYKCRCDLCRAAKARSRVRVVTGDTKAL